jgi:hypothetical protein
MEYKMRTIASFACLVLLMSPALGQQLQERQTVADVKCRAAPSWHAHPRQVAQFWIEVLLAITAGAGCVAAIRAVVLQPGGSGRRADLSPQPPAGWRLSPDCSNIFHLDRQMEQVPALAYPAPL